MAKTSYLSPPLTDRVFGDYYYIGMLAAKRQS